MCIRDRRGPGGEEVVAEAEPALEHDEAILAAPARGERIAVEEDVARLGERSRARVVDVAVLDRSWRAVVVADDSRRHDRRRLHLRVGSGPTRDASQASRRSRTPSRRRYASTVGDMLAIASRTRRAASVLVTASASGALSTWMV